MIRRMLRYEVLINDRPQTFTLSSTPKHVAAARLGVGPDAQHTVEFWVEGYFEPDETAIRRTFQVFGTGQPLPEDAIWRGTTDRWQPRDFVWHLYELPQETP